MDIIVKWYWWYVPVALLTLSIIQSVVVLATRLSAQAEARALVGELIKYINHKYQCELGESFANQRTCGFDEALTKAQAFVEDVCKK